VVVHSDSVGKVIVTLESSTARRTIEDRPEFPLLDIEGHQRSPEFHLPSRDEDENRCIGCSLHCCCCYSCYLDESASLSCGRIEPSPTRLDQTHCKLAASTRTLTRRHLSSYDEPARPPSTESRNHGADADHKHRNASHWGVGCMTVPLDAGRSKKGDIVSSKERP
jgi:hypothetical protein